MSTDELRIASWSGPRNISTAMMRAWGNRNDTVVCDEPLYAHYLRDHGLDHPGRDDILARHDGDLQRVVRWLTGPVPEGRRIFYQKHMAHHLLPEVPRAWLDQVTHVFLIRDPREMLTSFMQVIPRPVIADTGLPQQLEIFETVKRRTGTPPPVVDSRDVLENPRRQLGALCSAVGVEFQESMLRWPPGRRATDGAWAPHWYAAVETSTGWEPYRPKRIEVPESLVDVLGEAQRYYDELYAQRLR